MSSLLKPPSPSPPTYSAFPALDCNAAQLQFQAITLYFEILNSARVERTSLSLRDKWTDDRMTARTRERQKEREGDRKRRKRRGGLEFLRTSEALPTIYP